MSIEDAIKEKFPDATIYEVRNDRFGKCILGVVHLFGWFSAITFMPAIAVTRTMR